MLKSLSGSLSGLIFLVFLLISASYSYSQELGTPVLSDSLSISLPDSVLVDGVVVDNDVEPDSISDDLISSPIFYDATDSMIFDAVNQSVLLYGEAVVKFESLTLKAAFVEYNFGENTACASGVVDSTGVLIGKPVLNDSGKEFTQEYMCYNFKTKEGYSKIAVTQEGEAVFHAGISKRKENEWIHIKDGKFTTCDAENPHFHFHLKKAILIPDDKVVTGPFYLKVRKVPLPLALPFGWFPTKKESSHGIILPGYGNDTNLGFFLKQGGYYIPLGRHADTRILGDIYSRGSWALYNKNNYKVRYRYSGNLNLSYSVIKDGFRELTSFQETRNFFVNWVHNEDPKARPYSTFGANVNFGTLDNFRNTINVSQEDYVTNTFTSAISWRKTFPNKPFNLGVNMNHTQNNQTGIVSLKLPSVSFDVNRFFLPLSWLKSDPSASKKWYEQIGVSYGVDYENLINAHDSIFRWDGVNDILKETQSGVKHDLNLSTQMKVGFVSINPSFSYNNYWSFKRLNNVFDPETNTSSLDTVSTFNTASYWTARVTANTKFYGTFNFRKSESVKAIRHVLTPSIGLNYTPEYDRDQFSYLGEEATLERYTFWDLSRYKPPSSSEQGNVTFSLMNNLEMKVKDKQSKKKGEYKKVKLIESFMVSSQYNMVADSLNLGNINLTGFTSLYKNIDLQYRASYSAYDRDTLGNEINKFLTDSRDQLLRMESTVISLNSRFTSKNKTGEKNTENFSDEELENFENNARSFVDFSIPWSLNLSYNLNIRKQFDSILLADTNQITQTVGFDGDFSILKNWKIGFNSGYDITQKRLTLTTMTLYWDLHCWEFAFNYRIIGNSTFLEDKNRFGYDQYWSAQLNIKSSLLKDLKLQRRGGVSDNVRFW